MVNAVILQGAAVGLEALEGLEFSPHAHYTYCVICGVVFQTDLDRDVAFNHMLTLERRMILMAECRARRRRWSKAHARLHPDREHELLAKSGMWATPEAAHKLAAYGIIDIGDAIVSAEHSAALFESRPIPTDDSEA